MAMLQEVVDGIGIDLPGHFIGLGRQIPNQHQQAKNQNDELIFHKLAMAIFSTTGACRIRVVGAIAILPQFHGS
jgi:hypothetical protein